MRAPLVGPCCIAAAMAAAYLPSYRHRQQHASRICTYAHRATATLPESRYQKATQDSTLCAGYGLRWAKGTHVLHIGGEGTCASGRRRHDGQGLRGFLESDACTMMTHESCVCLNGIDVAD